MSDDSPLEGETPRATPSGENFYPAWLRGQEWWVNWVRTLPKGDADAMPSKQPVAPYDRGDAKPVPWRFSLPDDDHPSTTVETVEPWEGTRIGMDVTAPERVISDRLGNGIILPTDQRDTDGPVVTLIDWDDVRDPETGAIHPVCARALRETDCYVEISQSGKGVHQFVFADLPDGSRRFVRNIDDEPFVGDDRPAVEMYVSGRVCAMTGIHVAGTARDVGDGQGLVDRLCWEFGTAENNYPGRTTDPYGRDTDAVAADVDAEDDRDTTPSHGVVADAMREAATYDGPDPETWDLGDRSIEYRAVLEARTRSDELSSIANWELIGYAAALGHRDGLEQSAVVADLEAFPTPQYGFDHHRATNEVRNVYRKAENGNYGPPARSTLVEPGLLPERFEGDNLVSALPLARLAALEPLERRRYLKRRGLEWPDDTEVTERIHDAVVETMAAEDAAVVDAPTGGNKTGVAVETNWRDVDATGDRPTVLFCGTREARDEAVERADAAGLDHWVLRGRKELCPVARGDYDPANVDDDPDAPEPIVLEGQPASEWFDERCDERGLALADVHAEAEHRLNWQGRECPCCAGDYVCRTKAQWPNDGLVDDDGRARFDLVIATDPFAFVPSLTHTTNILQDEQPDYTEDFGLDAAKFANHGQHLSALNARLREAITAFLGRSDGGPDTFEELVTLARECATYDAPPWNEHAAPHEKPPDDLAERWRETFDALNYYPDRHWYFNDPRAHTLAPTVTRAIWKALIDSAGTPDADAFDANGRASATVTHTPPRLDDDANDNAGWNRTWVTIIIDDENNVQQVRNAPDLSTARSVVGLDARPAPWCWQRNVHPDVSVRAVLEPDERQLWRRFERGQIVVQLGDADRPTGKDGRYFTPGHARAVIERLHDYFADDFHAAGCASTVEDDVRDLLLEAGVPADECATLHYGEEKSRNDFADEVVGLVYGCIDPGDDYVLNWLAECGLDAEPERSETECDDCDGDGCASCDGHGAKRARGRRFVGPDADHAAELLASVRETHVAQMVGRFGRSLDVADGERNLTFVATDAVPDDLVDFHADGVQWVATERQAAIVAALEEREYATTQALADAVGCTREHARQTLVRLAERDDSPVRRRRGRGPHADRWRWRGGVVDDVQLGLDAFGNGEKAPTEAYGGECTWWLELSRINDNAPSDSNGPDATTGTASIGDDPPPDPADRPHRSSPTGGAGE